jgi:TRAP-type C4-dicarboxylate transport system permease small subunit
MNKVMKQVLFWLPRVLCILFALFLSLFALDVFSEDSSFWEQILGLLIHLVPVYVVAILLIVAWRWEWVGAIVFIGLALFYLSQAWGQEHWSAMAAISGPLTLIGVLFLLNWTYRAQLRAG